MPQMSGEALPSRVPGGADTLYECEFGRDQLGVVRSAVARHAAALGLTDRLHFNLVLAVNELTTNAIHHGGGQGCLRVWHHDSELWCEIADTGTGIPAERLDRVRDSGPGERGHGLWLTHHICAEVHIDTGRHGTRVLLRYPMSAAPAART